MEALRQRDFKDIENPYQPDAFIVIVNMACSNLRRKGLGKLDFECKLAQFSKFKIHIWPAPTHVDRGPQISVHRRMCAAGISVSQLFNCYA